MSALAVDGYEYAAPATVRTSEKRNLRAAPLTGTRPRTTPGLPPVPALRPPPTWDPVAFRMSGTTLRSAAERKAEAVSWTGNTGRGLNPPEEWGAAVARTAIECLLGFRPVQQLVRWLDEPVYEALVRRVGLSMREGTGKGPRCITRVRSKHVQRVDEHTSEVSVVLHDGERCRCAALRLERYHGRWLVTALEIG
ncbi:MAG TPA: Rv3235 family protein [Actinomycetaceae bacterium]|nr:Rv3235 family protein [Actinomycetaceae bacterium]